MKMKWLIILVMCAAVAVIIAGCKRSAEEEILEITDPGEVIDGGRVDNTDYDAPKTIESDELTYFNTMFYRDADFVYDETRSYRFVLNKSEDGKYIISEEDGNLECETDADFASKLQKLIRDDNLISFNGVDEYVAGISPEYGPYELVAEYASGERLKFVMNGDPSDKWTYDVLDLFAKEFGEHGINDFLPSAEDTTVTNFSLEYTFGDVQYSYGEMDVPLTEEESEDGFARRVYSVIWDRVTNEEITPERQADISKEYYEALQRIVEDENLLKFNNDESFPPGFDYDGTPQYFEFYVEYESGKVMNGFSDDSEVCSKFKPIAEKFTEYFEELLGQ